jgi:DNA-binding transcriptional regulator YiaG
MTGGRFRFKNNLASLEAQPLPITEYVRTLFPLPLTGRVLQLGFAHCSIRIQFSPKTRKQNHVKPLPDSIQTIGDWIQVKRVEKNLTPYQLGAKMGFASALIRSWESGASQPDDCQLKVLAGLLGCHTDVGPIKEDAFVIQFCRST